MASRKCFRTCYEINSGTTLQPSEEHCTPVKSSQPIILTSDQFKDLEHWSARRVPIHLPSARFSAREWRGGDDARSRRCASQKGLRDWTRIFYSGRLRSARARRCRWYTINSSGVHAVFVADDLGSSHRRERFDAVTQFRPLTNTPEASNQRRREGSGSESALVRRTRALVLKDHPSNFT